MIAAAICARKSTVKRVTLSRGRGVTGSTFRIGQDPEDRYLWALEEFENAVVLQGGEPH